MLREDQYFQTCSQEELWQRYCGFLDLSIGEFMEIQEELLMNEIELVADSTLGKKIMGNHKPKSVEEFRRVVPITTYEDYEPYLSEQQDSALAVKPIMWCHTTGRGGSFSWIPHSAEMVEEAVKRYLACCILACCSKRGEINVSPGVRWLITVGRPPYVSGSMVKALTQSFSARIIPPLEQAETMEFRQAIRKGFQIALKDGVDIIGALTGVLVRMGEELSQQTSSMKFSVSMLHPKVVLRLLRAWLRSKRERRPILPKDLWRPKGIVVSGIDTPIYRDEVARYWGSTPYEIYGGTEGLVYAMQSWNRKGMVFVPDLMFLEFIPYEEVLEQQDDKDYHPSTVLLNEVVEGKSYEIVITQFYGGPLLRYRLKDVIKVINLKDDETGVDLPHILFQCRADETIDLASFPQLDERTIWQAITNTGIKYADWVACKEYNQSQTFLRLYVELKEYRQAEELEIMIDEQLKIVDAAYKDIDFYLDLQPVRVTLLSPGTFECYTEEKTKEGASIADLKPIHINPSEAVIRRLLQLSEASSEKW